MGFYELDVQVRGMSTLETGLVRVWWSLHTRGLSVCVTCVLVSRGGVR